MLEETIHVRIPIRIVVLAQREDEESHVACNQINDDVYDLNQEYNFNNFLAVADVNKNIFLGQAKLAYREIDGISG